MTTTEAIPSGHPGNLSKEQEDALKQIWASLFALENKTDICKINGTSIDISEAAKHVTACGGWGKFHSTLWASPSSENPDANMLRFLRARKWNVSAALEMLTRVAQWRIEMGVDKIVERGEEVLNREMTGFEFQLQSGKAYLHGADRNDRPVFYVHVQVHESKQQTFETLRAYTLYCLETGWMFLVPPIDQCCMIFDMTGFGMRNMDRAFVMFLVRAFEAYYPDTLGTLIIHKAPWFFSPIWRALRPILPPVVVSKVVFTRTDKDLLEFIDADQLPKGMGGNEDWSWKYTPCVPGENARFHDATAKAEWVAKRSLLRSQFEEATRTWMRSSPSSSRSEAERSTLARDQAILAYRIASISADPYLRPRTVYHRHGNLLENGTVYWKRASGDKTLGVPVERLREMLVSGERAVYANPETDSIEVQEVVDWENEKGRVVDGYGYGHDGMIVQA